MAQPQMGIVGRHSQAQEGGDLPEEGVFPDVELERSALGGKHQIADPVDAGIGEIPPGCDHQPLGLLLAADVVVLVQHFGHGVAPRRRKAASCRKKAFSPMLNWSGPPSAANTRLPTRWMQALARSRRAASTSRSASCLLRM